MSQPKPLDTRGALLRELLHHKDEGLTLDELGGCLGITRNAVQQHVTALERDGLVVTVARRSTGGRPSRAYDLTEAGLELFPRRYDLLAHGMLESVRDSLGEAALEELLVRVADKLADERLAELRRLDGPERLEAVVRLMNELGYDARATADGGGIEAVNCIYHNLAARTRAVCRFDERLLSRLTGSEVRLDHCMAEGQGSCVFGRLDPKA